MTMIKVSQSHFTDEDILNRILFIRNQKVMLDKDLAELYGVLPRRLREQVKRNIYRFPSHFMFQLSESEIDEMVSHFATPSRKTMGGFRPYAFTEYGVLMLANVLKSKQAVAVSLRLVEIFVKIREMISDHKDIFLKLEKLEKKITGHDEDIKAIFMALKKLFHPQQKPVSRIGFRRNNEKEEG